LPIAVPFRFTAPLTGDAPDLGSDFSQRLGSANRAKESRAMHAICITMSRVNKIRHITQKKNARIATRCAQCDMLAAVSGFAARLHQF
jgi:hypothetical protein